MDELHQSGTDVEVQCYDEVTGKIITSTGTDPRISGKTTELVKITLSSGDVVRCTPEHLILDFAGYYVHAENLEEGDVLSGGHTVGSVEFIELDEPMNVYDLTVDRYLNFVLDNGLIVHNSGKSFSAKREITNTFLVTDDDIIIVDPEGEYYPLVSRLDGQVINLSQNSTDYINPLDIHKDYGDGEDPIALKSNFILSLCELVVGSKEGGLQPEEKSIIDRCVRKMYTTYFQDPQPDKMPILQDLYNLLLEEAKKGKEAANYIASALELYVTGSLNVFNNRTNVNLSNRLVCFNIRELQSHLKAIGMLILQDAVWGRVSYNRELKRKTFFYVDEFHLLLKDEQTASYSVGIWKRFRKWGGVPTGITQNIKDLLSSREVENIFENTPFIIMLNQAAGDRAVLAKSLGISPEQLSFVTQSGAGEGLLFFGHTIIPFIDRWNKESELYGLMTTRIEEVS